MKWKNHSLFRSVLLRLFLWSIGILSKVWCHCFPKELFASFAAALKHFFLISKNTVRKWRYKQAIDLESSQSSVLKLLVKKCCKVFLLRFSSLIKSACNMLQWPFIQSKSSYKMKMYHDFCQTQFLSVLLNKI